MASEISELTISDYEKIFGVSNNTARRDLNKLLEYHLVNLHKNGTSNVFKVIHDVIQ